MILEYTDQKEPIHKCLFQIEYQILFDKQQKLIQLHHSSEYKGLTLKCIQGQLVIIHGLFSFVKTFL